jgi:hypothetical protein
MQKTLKNAYIVSFKMLMNHKFRENWKAVIMACLKRRTFRYLVCTEENRKNSIALVPVHAKMRPRDIRNANGGPIVFWYE